jgi:two-component sensor histidine kinase
VICTERDGELSIVWTERGGPPVTARLGPEGFGSKLISRSITGQLKGTMAFDWAPAGVVITLRIARDRIAF